LIKLAEKYCPLCLSIDECKLETRGMRPRLDQEATELYGYPSYTWGRCERLQKQIIKEQIKNNISERFENRTFESFSITPQNKQAFDICWNYATNFSRSTIEGLILVGHYGTGKTHLAAAILKVVLDKAIPGAMVVVPELLDEIRASYNDVETDKRLEQKVMQKQFLILDDLGAEKTTEWVRERLYNLINHRYEHNLPTVITTNCTFNELSDKHGERIVDRIAEMCHGVKLEGESYRIKIRKQKKAKAGR